MSDSIERIDDDAALAESAGEDKPEQQSLLRWMVETALLVLLAFALAQGVKTFIVQPFTIPSGSMIPTIEEGDYVLAEKLSLRFSGGPEQGDIVVFDDPGGDKPQLIKRVIAVAGQTVDVRDGGVYVDGKRLDEPYTHGKPTTHEPGMIRMPVTVPDGFVWMMGDNRPNSGDSRYFGPVPVDSVHGRAFWTYWPVGRFGKLE